VAIIAGVARLVGAACAGQVGVMADPKGSKGAMAADGIQARNTIAVAMEDLTKPDRKELEKELEEEMAKRRRKKLACFQKTCHGVVKKADTAAASGLR
jgi:hypothetical protein